MKLSRLLALQAFYPAMAIAYLLASYWQAQTGGAQFSKAEPLTNIALFLVYAACLLLGVAGKHTPYRIAMGAAILLFATGGVFLNIANVLRTGLEGYSSLAAWGIGVAINAYGMIWNIIAATGRYER